jgi:hypothetical protein
MCNYRFVNKIIMFQEALQFNDVIFFVIVDKILLELVGGCHIFLLGTFLK